MESSDLFSIVKITSDNQVFKYLEQCVETLQNDDHAHPVFYCLSCDQIVKTGVILHQSVASHQNCIGALCIPCNKFLISVNEEQFSVHLESNLHKIISKKYNTKRENKQQSGNQDANIQPSPTNALSKSWKNEEAKTFLLSGFGPELLNLSTLYELFSYCGTVVFISYNPEKNVALVTLENYDLTLPLYKGKPIKLKVHKLTLRGEKDCITWKYDEISNYCVSIMELKSRWTNYFEALITKCCENYQTFKLYEWKLKGDLQAVLKLAFPNAKFIIKGPVGLGIVSNPKKSFATVHLENVGTDKNELVQHFYGSLFSIDEDEFIIHNHSGYKLQLNVDNSTSRLDYIMEKYMNEFQKARILIICVREWWDLNCVVEESNKWKMHVMCDWLVLFYLIENSLIKCLPEPIFPSEKKMSVRPEEIMIKNEFDIFISFIYFYWCTKLCDVILDFDKSSVVPRDNLVQGDDLGVMLIKQNVNILSFINKMETLAFERRVEATARHMMQSKCSCCPFH